MARAYGGSFTALYVKTPATEKLNKDDRERLNSNIKLAQQLGAEIVTLYGEDVPSQIVEFARISKVTKVVLGHGNATVRSFFLKESLTDKLINLATGLDVHIIPDFDTGKKLFIKKAPSKTPLPSLKNIGIFLLILLVSTLLGFIFRMLSFTSENIITVYIFGALLTGLFTKNHICSAAYSTASVVLFNFFFTEPRFSLIAYESGYPVTFVIMLVASLITGTLANRLATSARISANGAYRTDIMLRTNQLLQKAESEDEVLDILAQQVLKLLSRDMVIYPIKDGKLTSGKVFLSEKDADASALTGKTEENVAAWVLEHRKRAGAGTGRMGNARCQYLAVRTDDIPYCIMGIEAKSKSIEPFEESILISILGECALAIENIQNAREKEQIALLAKNEQLRADLLRSISHDLRTPLTSISGNTENLLSNFEMLDENTRRTILTDIYNDTDWLIGLVENLLSITRISEGRMTLNMTAQLVDEVVLEALRHIGRKGEKHRISTSFDEELLLAKMDARLISQVIFNLVDNAIKYTPSGSEITVNAKRVGGMIEISVSDNGAGIDDTRKEDVFKMFYTGENKIADCRRSLGLGLALCRSIVEAHGGRISLSDNEPCGSVFTFTLPSSEVHLNE